MRAIQVAKKGGPLELVERELPQPGRGEVRVKVQACGVCHGDSIAKEGLFPNAPYPIVGCKNSLNPRFGSSGLIWHRRALIRLNIMISCENWNRRVALGLPH